MRTHHGLALGISLALFSASVGCSSGTGGSDVGPALDASTTEDARTESDAVADVALASDAGDGPCAQTFGGALTAGFGRLDGTLRAIVRPGVEGCGPVNGSHLVLQLDVQGAPYRVVINVASDRGDDRRVRLDTRTHALPAPAFSEGWHLGVTLDYVTEFALHSTDFTPYERDALVAEVLRGARVGAPVAVYSTNGGSYRDSTHLVHRNGGNHDGAVVFDPQGASPTWLLFHFVEQTF